MTDRSLRLAASCLILGLAALSPLLALEVPFLAGRVNDLAEILSPEAESRIEARLAALEQARGSQIAILTLPGLGGENLEDFSMQVAETWKLGRADVDDGVLLLIARDDRKMRLEVGYGLEGVLTDAYSRRILDEILRPHFRAGDFDTGVERAIGAAASMIEGDDLLPPPSSTRSVRTGRSGVSLFFLVFAVPFVLGIVRTPGCGAWGLYILVMPFAYLFANTIAGPPLGTICVGVWAVLFPLLRLLMNKFGGPGGPTFFGSTGGWSSSGGSFGGGGFSGGGGSFGGGGSSSGW